jgi:hypothetical protein
MVRFRLMGVIVTGEGAESAGDEGAAADGAALAGGVAFFFAMGTLSRRARVPAQTNWVGTLGMESEVGSSPIKSEKENCGTSQLQIL